MSWVMSYVFSFQLEICISIRMDRKCKNSPDRFCYICRNVVLPNHQAKITDFTNQVNRDYFGVKEGDQDKRFTFAVKHVENLRDWRNGKRKSIPFTIPMVRREGKDHITDCYFRVINLKVINRKNKHYVQYPNVSSAIRPILHGPDIPVPKPDGNMEYCFDFEHSDCCSWGWRI